MISFPKFLKKSHIADFDINNDLEILNSQHNVFNSSALKELHIYNEVE